MASSRPQSNTTGPGVMHALGSTLHALTAPLAGLGTRTRSLSRQTHTIWLSSTLLVIGIATGILLSTSVQSQAASSVSASSPLTRQAGREIVSATISRLESEQAELKTQIADLRAQISTFQSTGTKHKSTLQDINKEIERQRIASGVMALQGPGVVATFDDSTARTIPENEDPGKYIIHEYDLRDIINTLWISGAEAVSLNGERIVNSTSLYCVGTTVICNATRLSPPYEIRAIGDPQALAAALQGSPQMEKFNHRALVYELPVKIEESQEVLVPAYNGSIVFKHATVPGDE